ncbi:putative short chain dehydrogenase [Actinacidiphila reveromycinica]|uniref:Putative short chain dehydrogenase n=1 Tax=Actinacidiphila reveromycinica TaxID=659352 RepID=A0A7U3UYR0_9ACTN|nr:SDR family oxidoreductase [Streptomyces sp. SN-593]BBB01319.1 putative short chain dehydrogenase [Streptomyces sp. SN-593]
MTGIGIEGKAVVVTGSARGLGLGYARHLLAAGARVVLNDLDAEFTRAVAGELGAGDAVAWCAGSVADPATADALVATCLRHFGRIDGLVNNAGVRPEGLSWEEDPEATRRAVEVNLLGTLYCGAAALRVFQAQDSGSVVNVSSRAQTGIERSATYAATKGAVASLTYSWALDAPPGVRVNAIAPQARGTGTRRAGWVPRPEEPEPDAMAPLVTFLLSDAARGVRGQVVRMIGTTDGLALGLVHHPRGGRLLADPRGWTAEGIAAAFDAELGREQDPVGALSRPVGYLRLGDTRVTVR